MLRVGGDGDFERVSGSNLGGGTFWGLCRLMTGCKNFDEMLELSARGDNSKVGALCSCSQRETPQSKCSKIALCLIGR